MKDHTRIPKFGKLPEPETVIICTNHRCNPDEVFVEAPVEGTNIPSWRKKLVKDTTRHDEVIKCATCGKDAHIIDCHWPWMTGMNSCGACPPREDE